MAFGMLAGPHFSTSGAGYGSVVGGTGLWVALAIIALLEVNALAGKMGPITTVKGVIHASIALTAVLAAIVMYV